MLARDPLAAEGSISAELSAHLVRDIGPAAAKAGGDLFLLAPITSTLSRGETIGGRLPGIAATHLSR